MANSTADILTGLHQGMEAKLYADPGLVQIAQYSLTGFAILCALVAVFQFFKQLSRFTSGQQSLVGWVSVVLAGIAAFFLYEKANTFQVLDSNDPVIVIDASALQYDTKKNGWSVSWRDIETVELNTQTHEPKQSVAEVTQEVRVRMKEGANVAWKYEILPENQIAGVKSLYETSHYLVINPEPLGVSHSTLAEALERYRTGP